MQCFKAQDTCPSCKTRKLHTIFGKWI